MPINFQQFFSLESDDFYRDFSKSSPKHWTPKKVLGTQKFVDPQPWLGVPDSMMSAQILLEILGKTCDDTYIHPGEFNVFFFTWQSGRWAEL